MTASTEGGGINLKKSYKDLSPSDALKKYIKGYEGSKKYLYDDGVFPSRKFKKNDVIVKNLTIGVGLHESNEVMKTKYLDKDIDDTEIDRLFDEDLKKIQVTVNRYLKKLEQKN